MLGKLFGRKKEKPKATATAQAAEQPLDEDETIVISLTDDEQPKPADVRLEFEDPAAPAPSHRFRPEASKPPRQMVSGRSAAPDDTQVWTGPDFQTSSPVAPAEARGLELTAGWLVITSEKGRGRSYPVKLGRNKLGRGQDNAICVEVGDSTISKDNHVTLAADPKTKRFFAVPGDSTNFAYLNDEPLLEPKALEDKAVLQVGATVFTFVQFAGNYVDWE